MCALVCEAGRGKAGQGRQGYAVRERTNVNVPVALCVLLIFFQVFRTERFGALPRPSARTRSLAFFSLPMPPTSDPAATFLARLRQRSTQGARPEGRWPFPKVRVGGQGRGRERGALLPLFHSTTPPPLLTPLLPFSAVATTRTQIPPSLITPAEALGPDLQAGVILGFVGPQGAGGNPGAGLLADLAGPPLPGGLCRLRLWATAGGGGGGGGGGGPAALVAEVPLFESGARWLGVGEEEEDEDEEEGGGGARAASGAGVSGSGRSATAAARPQASHPSLADTAPLLVQVMEAPMAGVLFVLGRPLGGGSGGHGEEVEEEGEEGGGGSEGGQVGFLTALTLPPPGWRPAAPPHDRHPASLAWHARFPLPPDCDLALPPPPPAVAALVEVGWWAARRLARDGAGRTGRAALLALPLADRLLFVVAEGGPLPRGGVGAACLWEPFLAAALGPLLEEWEEEGGGAAPAAASPPPPPRHCHHRRIADYGAAVVCPFGPGEGGAGGGGRLGGALVALVARLVSTGHRAAGGAAAGAPAPAALPPSPARPLDVLLFASVCAGTGAATLASPLTALAPPGRPPRPAGGPPPPSVLSTARAAARAAARAGGLGHATLAAAVTVHSNAPALVGGRGGSLPALVHPRGPSAVVAWGRGGGGGGRAA